MAYQYHQAAPSMTNPPPNECSRNAQKTAAPRQTQRHDMAVRRVRIPHKASRTINGLST